MKSSCTVVATIVVELLIFKMYDVCTNIVQEVLVVRNDEQSLSPVLQVATQETLNTLKTE